MVTLNDKIMAVVLKHYENMYDPSDPSMQALGAEEWSEQCETACDHLSAVIGHELRKNEEQLLEGQFYTK
jgi:hypothetical protein